MKFELKKPCKECPFLALMPGWIGSHKSAMEFHDAVMNDVRFSCHLTHDKTEHHCVGYALYMNAVFKLSKDPEMLEFQNSIEEYDSEKLLNSFDGSVLVQFHGK